jgi:hypothetical protein
MPFGIIVLLINVGLIVHAAKTGRFWPWGYIILFIPGFGALAYVLVELAPAWFGSVQGQKARRHVVNTLDPSKRYRALTEQLEIADTIANRAALAEECLELGKFTEAEYHYERILALPMGDDPIYAFGRARAQFGRSHPQEAVATLDDLRKRWPDYQSADAHLLYARGAGGKRPHRRCALRISGGRELLSGCRSARALRPAARQSGPAERGEGGVPRGPYPAQARAQICPPRAGGMDRARRKGAARVSAAPATLSWKVRCACVTTGGNRAAWNHDPQRTRHHP